MKQTVPWGDSACVRRVRIEEQEGDGLRPGKDRRLIYPPFYFRLAKLYLQRGDPQKAIRAFRKFISIWKDCDPLFQPMVRDARKELNALTGSG